MHREDKSLYLLYIEPAKSQKSKKPVEDELVSLMELALLESKSGTAHYSNLDDDGSTFRGGSGYRGCHTVDCGERSGNKDYQLKNGMITNSLAPFYLRWYRDAIPATEMNKVEQLKKYYNLKK
jgi:hypothetical protein|tara:strand:- start:1791 stop:2159 length:369 start_codon:yes stop_codon:yes gene_type:complete